MWSFVNPHSNIKMAQLGPSKGTDGSVNIHKESFKLSLEKETGSTKSPIVLFHRRSMQKLSHCVCSVCNNKQSPSPQTGEH